VIIKQLPPEVVIQYVPQYVYETVYETITRDPTDEEIKTFIKQLPPEYIIKYLTDEQLEYIKEQIPPKVVIEQLPPEVVIQYVPQYVYETVYETITRDPTDEEIQEFIKRLPPKFIFQYLTDDQIAYIESLLPGNIKYVQLPPEIIIQYETVYQYIYETEYQTIYETLTRNPTDEEIQECIKQLPPEYIFQYLTDTQIEYIKSQIPPQVIIQQLPPEVLIQTETVYETIYETIMREPTEDEIKKIIQQLPPEFIINYLTDEQISVIKELIPPQVIIQQLPPQIWLQSISIVDIEYIIFSGDATVYNANSPTSGGTNLTTQEKASNDDILRVMADALHNKNYMLILHGHANPVTGSAEEAVQLTQISLDRANSVKSRIELLYTDGEPLDNRITTKGYGGERNVSVSGSSVYSSLNRRVEAILITIMTDLESGGG
jgi:ribosomal protein S13